MDRQTLERNLARANDRVREGERHIVNQQGIVRKLEADGHDATMANQLLATLVDLQATHRSDRDRIVQEIELAEAELQQEPLRVWAGADAPRKDAPRSN